MAIAEAQHFDDDPEELAIELRKRMPNSKILCGIADEPLALCRESVHSSAQGSVSVREDVERALDLYVRLEMFRIGSNMGRFTIDETRLSRKRPKLESTEPSNAEERSERRISNIRRAVYAQPSAPSFTNHDGSRMRRVAPLRDVASIVQVKGGHASARAATDGPLQLWKSTWDTKLSRIARMCVLRVPCPHVPALLDAACLRVEIEAERSSGSHAERELGSRTRRKRLGEDGVERARRVRDAAKEASRALVVRRMTITRSVVYEEAIDLADLACSEDAETRAYCFREIA